MASELEKIPDRLLFEIIKKVARNCASERISFVSLNTDVVQVIDDTLKIFGVVDEISYIDEDYICTLVNLNEDKLSEDKLTDSLIKPQLKEYKFDTQVNETIYQSQTWENTVESYGNPYQLVKLMNYDGNFNHYDGRESGTEIHDSETNDISIDRKSFTRI